MERSTNYGTNEREREKLLGLTPSAAWGTGASVKRSIRSIIDREDLAPPPDEPDESDLMVEDFNTNFDTYLDKVRAGNIDLAELDKMTKDEDNTFLVQLDTDDLNNFYEALKEGKHESPEEVVKNYMHQQPWDPPKEPEQPVEAPKQLEKPEKPQQMDMFDNLEDMTPNMEEQGSQLDNTIPGFNDNNEENL